MNDVTKSERVHIAFFGGVNAGKSSLINAVTSQNLSIVSSVEGTTADPVYKAMEILPLGAVVLIDTAGYDDNTVLGQKRSEKTFEVLRKTDVAILVADASKGLSQSDEKFISLLKEKNIKSIIAYNKCDLAPRMPAPRPDEIFVSAKTRENIEQLKEMIALKGLTSKKEKTVIEGIVKPKDFVILVTPIDSSAPKGRLILPQQRVLRELLDIGAITTVVQPSELKNALELSKNPPALVITDSQAFKDVNEILPANIPFTSFSVLFARYKGVLTPAIQGVYKIDELKDGDKILISEGCTHHRQCEDIGTVKLPRLLQKHTGKNLKFEFSSGNEFSSDLSGFKLVICCGGCMLNENEVLFRYNSAKNNNIPITNYGTALAFLNGILERSIAVFKIR